MPREHTEQYLNHDWSSLAWALMLGGMIVFVVATIGLFLLMVNRACNVTAAPPTGPVPAT